MDLVSNFFDFSLINSKDFLIGQLNYKSLIFVEHFLNKNLTMGLRAIQYINENKFLFFDQFNNNIDNVIEKNSNHSSIAVSNLYQLLEVIKDYDLICVDEIFIEDVIARSLSAFYIKQSKFIDSFEGNVWDKIFALQSFLQADIMNYFVNELYQKNSMPMIKYSKFKNHDFIKQISHLLENNKLIELFELISKIKPLWQPLNRDFDFLNNAILFEKFDFSKNEEKKYIFDKSLIDYARRKVAYIGSHGNIIDKLPPGSISINYKCEFKAYKQWDSLKQKEFKINTTYEEKLKLQGNLAKLYAHKLHLKIDDPNIYSYIKNCAKKEIQNIVANKLQFKGQKIQSELKSDLKSSGIDCIKILNNMQNLIDNFFCVFDQFNNYHAEFDKIIGDVLVDCVLRKKDSFVLILLSWSDFSYVGDVRVQKLVEEKNVEKIYIITTKKIVDVDFCAKFNVSEKEKNVTQYDDLFYWYS